MHIITQKGDPYTKLFSTLSGVTMMSCILSELNMLCNNLIKPHFTKMTTHLLFTVHMLRPYAFSNVLDLIITEYHRSERSVLYLTLPVHRKSYRALRHQLQKVAERGRLHRPVRSTLPAYDVTCQLTYFRRVAQLPVSRGDDS